MVIMPSYMLSVTPISCLQGYKHSNCIWVPETLGTNILIMQGVHFTFTVKVYQEIIAISSHEARLPYPASLTPDMCTNWVTCKPGKWSVMCPIQLCTEFCSKR